jgi:hypothetical protein
MLAFAHFTAIVAIKDHDATIYLRWLAMFMALPLMGWGWFRMGQHLFHMYNDTREFFFDRKKG